MSASEVPKFADPAAAARLFEQMAHDVGASEVAVVRNPAYVAQPFDLYALAPKRDTVETLDAAVCDMDGTLTTTEPLCVHSLEYMIRQITDRMAPADWPGVDPLHDLPHIIGNSTTRHVEYLVEAYRQHIRPAVLERVFREAVAWTRAHGRPTGRLDEVEANDRALGGGAALREMRPLDIVRAGVDIYYARYHQILEAIARGEGERLAAELLGQSGGVAALSPFQGERGGDGTDRSAAGRSSPSPPPLPGRERVDGVPVFRHLIEPMPGVGPFIALIRGWLGAEAGRLAGVVIGESGDAAVLADLGRRFERRPAKLAVVTSSILYEAEIVLAEVIRLVRDGVAAWPVGADRRRAIAHRFLSLGTAFDAVVTATDSSEIRLKPHRDLYALALHRLGVPRDRYDCVVGFEDSESGTVAIRAAGIGVCCAVPFAMTGRHDFTAASHVAEGGLPEVILKKRCFLA